MKLFSMTENELNEVNRESFELEKNIQSITEYNMDKIFGLELIKREYQLDNLRIDSLCFDKSTKSFVIIEYKNKENFSVIDQGYSYLSLLLNNKADFVLLYNELKNESLRKNDVEWSQSKVIFVSPSYTTYQKRSINFKDLPIELWEIQLFENKTIIYSPIKATHANETIKTISSNDDKISAVSKEVKAYSEEDHLHRASDEIQEMYETIKAEILNLGDIILKPTKLYIAFVGNKKNIVDFVIKKDKIKVYINLKFPEIEDYKNRVRDVTHIGSWGNGDCEFSYESINDLDYLLYLVKQSYKKNG